MAAIKIFPGDISKNWQIPGNKSFANRALIVSALTSDPVTLTNLPDSTDVVHLCQALRSIGLAIDSSAGECTIRGNFLRDEILCDDIIEVDAGDGGTTNRFLMALLSRGRNRYLMRPSGAMISRPMDGLINALKILGVEISGDGQQGYLIRGPITKLDVEVQVDCYETSQFLSALYLCSFDLNLNLKAKNLKGSQTYIEQTLDVIEKVCRVGDQELNVPVDFSAAGYPLLLGAVNPPLTIDNCLTLDRYQADSIFIEILKNIGVDLSFSTDGLKITDKGEGLKAIDVDASGFPDLAPTLCLLASFCEGESYIKNIHSLKFKESDRLAEVSKLLKTFRIDNEVYKDSTESLKIRGTQKKRHVGEVKYQAPDDHRMIMIAAILMSLHQGGVIENYEHVNKSFPEFFQFLSTQELK